MRDLQTTFSLRQFKPDDLDDVIRVNHTCLPENYSAYFFMDLYERYPATFIVAEIGNEIVGYIMCRIETGFSHFGLFGISKKGHVVSVAVLPEYQRKGIGTDLLRKAMYGMRLYGAKECYLEVRTTNSAAVRMYDKLDFKTVRKAKAYYADGEDAHVMAKKLK